MIRVANGRTSRAYFFDRQSDPLVVTYHRRVNGRMRMLTISARLLAKVLREAHS